MEKFVKQMMKWCTFNLYPDPLALKPSIFGGMKFVMAAPKLLLFRVTLSSFSAKKDSFVNYYQNSGLLDCLRNLVAADAASESQQNPNYNVQTFILFYYILLCWAYSYNLTQS